MLNFPSTWQVVGDMFSGGTDLAKASLIGAVEELERLSIIGRKTGNRNGSSVKTLTLDATKLLVSLTAKESFRNRPF